MEKEIRPPKKPLNKKQMRALKRRLQRGEITTEQYDILSGRAPPPTQKKKESLLDEGGLSTEELERAKQAQYTSGLESLQTKTTVVDSTSKDIHLENFTISYEGRKLLVDTSLHISHGRKYGIIGPNGSGKSTLLRHIAHRHLPIQKHIRMLFVEQEVEGTETLALDAVLEADEERTALLAEEEKLKPIAEDNTEEGLAAADRLIEVYARLKEINAYSAKARAGGILHGLGFTNEMVKQPTKTFSGGWRMRISLARALFVRPDLLLLDEPTNHLDLNACIWLETYLRRWKNTLIIVSHDRDFLNWLVTDIIHLHSHQLNYYKGNYDTFEKVVLQQQATHAKQYRKQQSQLRQIQAKQTKDAKDKKKQMLKSGLIQQAEKAYRVTFEFPSPGPLGFPVISVKEVTFGYTEDKILFRDLDLRVDLDSRIAICGPNGVGKSTLVSVILNELKPLSGEVIHNRHLRTAKFSQHFMDQLKMTDTPIEFVQRVYPDLKVQEIRGLLGKYGLPGKMHTQLISILSGGQKSRVVFTVLALKQPHILFLDEPTNHLDIESVDALAEALRNFEGGVLLISHDQRLISSCCDDLWIVGDETAYRFDGEFEDYKQMLINEMDDEWFDEESEEEEIVHKKKKKKGTR